jgi:hypothetical protein
VRSIYRRTGGRWIGDDSLDFHKEFQVKTTRIPLFCVWVLAYVDVGDDGGFASFEIFERAAIL